MRTCTHECVLVRICKIQARCVLIRIYDIQARCVLMRIYTWMKIVQLKKKDTDVGLSNILLLTLTMDMVVLMCVMSALLRVLFAPWAFLFVNVLLAPSWRALWRYSNDNSSYGWNYQDSMRNQIRKTQYPESNTINRQNSSMDKDSICQDRK